VGRKDTMEKKCFKMPSKEEQTTDLSLLKKMNKEVEAPDSVEVWFPGPIIVSDERWTDAK